MEDTAEVETRTPDEWCKMIGVIILDPDGWDRTNFTEDWARSLTRTEFYKKMNMSTTLPPPKKGS